MHKPESIHYKYDNNTQSFRHEFKNDYQLFIIWENGRNKEEKILDDLKSSFDILRVEEIQWSNSVMGDNFHRLYNFPATGRASTKSKLTGEGAFILVIVNDLNPRYEYRSDASGHLKLVNSNVVDKKSLYRKWTGGGYLIHSTDNRNEFFSNIALLLPFEKIQTTLAINSPAQSLIQKNKKVDLVGASGWDSVEQLFSVLNLSSQYVVLRNPEGIEDNANTLNGDVDILCLDKKSFVSISNAKKVGNFDNFYHINIGGKHVLFDIREAAEEYFDIKWQHDILKRRVLNANNIYVPRVDDYFFSHLYHSNVHKVFDCNKYSKRLFDLANSIGLNIKELKSFELEAERVEILNGYLKAHGYKFVLPDDHRVYLNLSFISKLTGQSKVSFIFRKISHSAQVLPKKWLNSTKEWMKKQRCLYQLVTVLRRFTRGKVS